MLTTFFNKAHTHAYYTNALKMSTYIIFGHPLNTSPKYGNKHYSRLKGATHRTPQGYVNCRIHAIQREYSIYKWTSIGFLSINGVPKGTSMPPGLQTISLVHHMDSKGNCLEITFS
jgi:hypothetical protein